MRNARVHRKTPRSVWFVVLLASVLILPGAGLTLANISRASESLDSYTRKTQTSQRQDPSENDARETCQQKHLRFIAYAMHLYAEKNQWQLPPAATYDVDGKPLLSWRVHILPFLEEDSLYNEFRLDEPWDSPHNRKLISRMPAVFACPNQKREAGKTSYLVPVGEKTLFPPSGKGFPLNEIPDGTSNTILCLEVNDEHTVTWTKPEDLDYNPDENLTSKLTGHHAAGFNIQFADGASLFVRETVDPETIHRAINREDGKPLSFGAAEGHTRNIPDKNTRETQTAQRRAPSEQEARENTPKTGPDEVQTSEFEIARARGSKKMMYIALAMHQYAEEHQSILPAAASYLKGEPLLSWRVHILPYIEEEALYREFHLDEPWDSPHNRELIKRMPAIYRCPGQKTDEGKTCFLVPSGEKTLFPPQVVDGIARHDIMDDWSHTILLLDVNDEHAVVWTKPEDFQYDPDENPIPKLVGHHQGGFSVEMVSGLWLFLPENLADLKTLHTMFTYNGGEPVAYPMK